MAGPGMASTLLRSSALFGVATSLGLGALQIAAGLERLFAIPPSDSLHLCIIGVVTAIATVSVVSGLRRGIRRLSEINVLLASLLLIFVLASGPTGTLVRESFIDLVTYLKALPLASFDLRIESPAQREWLGNWTIFYWAWWIAWSPFVGMFIARISRGRTVREFLVGVLLVPSLLTFVWLGVFGNAALHEDSQGSGEIGLAVQENVATALFAFLQQYPYSSLTTVVALVSVILFFVTDLLPQRSTGHMSSISD